MFKKLVLMSRNGKKWCKHLALHTRHRRFPVKQIVYFSSKLVNWKKNANPFLIKKLIHKKISLFLKQEKNHTFKNCITHSDCYYINISYGPRYFHSSLYEFQLSEYSLYWVVKWSVRTQTSIPVRHDRKLRSRSTWAPPVI